MHLQEEPSRLSAILESADDGICEWFGGIAGSLCSKGAGFNSDDAPAGTALAALSGLAGVGSFGCEELASTVLRINSSAPHFKPERTGRPTLQTRTHGAQGYKTYSWPSSR